MEHVHICALWVECTVSVLKQVVYMGLKESTLGSTFAF
jgi:hypothetical protein